MAGENKKIYVTAAATIKISEDKLNFCRLRNKGPVPLAARSKAWVYGRSPAEIVGSNPTGGMDVWSVVSVVCCQVEVSATN